MQITYNPTHRTLVVELGGDLDHHSATAYRERIDNEFRTSKANHIVFDMSSLKFMDSSGIGLIMGRYRLVSPLGGRIILAGVSTQMDRLMSISGIYKLVAWSETADAALKQLERRSS